MADYFAHASCYIDQGCAIGDETKIWHFSHVMSGARIGFLQRTSVYWPTNHEAGDHAAGVAVIRGHTAYHVPMFKTRVEVPPPNRPGIPPVVITWADAAYLAEFQKDIAALRPQVDILVASCHWGLKEDVLAPLG